MTVAGWNFTDRDFRVESSEGKFLSRSFGGARPWSIVHGQLWEQKMSFFGGPFDMYNFQYRRRSSIKQPMSYQYK